MPANLAVFCRSDSASLEVGCQPPNAHRCAAVRHGDGDARAGERQSRFHNGLIGIISSGSSAVSGVLATVNSTLQNVIVPLLSSISGAMAAIQSITQGILDFQQNTVYPLAAINSARALVGQVQGIDNAIRGIWNTAVRSATLENRRAWRT